MRLTVLNIPGHNPLDNILLDEKLLYLKDDQLILRAWINNPAVFTGYCQDPEYEVNQAYLRKKNIPLLKRFTGGGAVYHDNGCLNITVCKKLSPPLYSENIDEESIFITGIIKDAIEEEISGLEIKGINAIFFNGEKLLGSSMAIKNRRFLYHASLLVDVDLQELQNCLTPKSAYPSAYRYVKSKRAAVTNLRMLFETDIQRTRQAVLNRFQERLSLNDLNHITSIEAFNHLNFSSFKTCSVLLG